MSLCGHIRIVKNARVWGGSAGQATLAPLTRVLFLSLLLGGCLPRPKVRVPGVSGDPCDARGRQVATIARASDGKPTVRTLSLGSRVTCRQSDADADGRPELEQAFDEAGALVRERFDLDGDGRFDRTDHLVRGVVERRELDTNGDGRPDVRLIFARGQLSRLEADEDADGRFDYWEEWRSGQLVRSGLL